MDCEMIRQELQKAGVFTEKITNEQLEKIRDVINVAGGGLYHLVNVLTGPINIREAIYYGGYLSNNHRRMNGKAPIRLKQILNIR
ncbi:hypothetical protein [Anaerophilus nitritogenes]|uniref:hypothetical protein n=1 Tax=Anaerophilus nitritogenes TaxID=2498136 RepID=UPI00101BA51C|nr:hypothetical protein [Anaerophilus nitritogenes]